MSATVFATVASFQMIGSSKYHEAILHIVKFFIIAAFFFFHQFLNANPLGPIPTVKLPFDTPSDVYEYTVPLLAKAFESAR